jgi:N-acetylmuramoyl-L-alanine amidase
MCPAVLTENMFMDSREDVKFLLSREGKQKCVDVHVDGIIRYLEVKS